MKETKNNEKEITNEERMNRVKKQRSKEESEW